MGNVIRLALRTGDHFKKCNKAQKRKGPGKGPFHHMSVWSVCLPPQEGRDFDPLMVFLNARVLHVRAADRGLLAHALGLRFAAGHPVDQRVDTEARTLTGFLCRRGGAGRSKARLAGAMS